MDKKGKIYTVRYTYILEGRECKTTWCGRAETADDAVEKSSKWYDFGKSGATVTGVQTKELVLNKED